MNRDDRSDNMSFKVTVNHEEQYSIWPADREDASGWQDKGKTDSKNEGLARVYGMRKNPEQTVIPSSVSPPPSLSPVPLARSQISSSAGLTVREREVLCLLTQGLTNPQIAKCLVISLPTVNTHVGSIYKKLNVSTRSAATRYAIERHLV